ncbi:MAG: SH3 domain-containing protein [bacterium]|nr:SH3 domain-containing protein [bacterium]
MKYRRISMLAAFLLAGALCLAAGAFRMQAEKTEENIAAEREQTSDRADIAAPTEEQNRAGTQEPVQTQRFDLCAMAEPDGTEDSEQVLLYGGIWKELKDAKVVTGADLAALQESILLNAAGNSIELLTAQEPQDGGNAPTDRAVAGGNEAAGDLAGEEDYEYADLALADVRHYVNVRTAATTGSSVVGKIYGGAVAQILETVEGENGQWFRIVSGNVEGYIKSEYFLYGQAAAEAIDDYVTRYATVIVTRLNVRQDPDIESKRIGFLDSGERLKVLETQEGWLKVQYTDTKTGYVSAEYVTVSEEFVYAKTLKEEAAENAARRALEERQRMSETQTTENTAVTVTPPSGNYADNAELRREIVEYAMQFLGNRYVHGGQSLVTGTDCSGFTSLIYAEFGYSISRTPAGQLKNAGRGISYSEIQPGDIICYGSKKCSHVGLYIGDGQIIHAANSRKGVVISQADYDTILGVRNVID